jgi:catechol 2,3-dioxygenase-like lactoylglutathione lyase family enzyme
MRDILLDHTSIGVADLERSRRFYDKALAPLGIVGRATASEEVGYARAGVDPTAPAAQAFFIGFEDPTAKRAVIPAAGSHVAFVARSRGAVDAFYRAALEAGGRDHGAPGLRPAYHSTYYGAFVLDPDGHHVEAVFHGEPPEPAATLSSVRVADAADLEPVSALVRAQFAEHAIELAPERLLAAVAGLLEGPPRGRVLVAIEGGAASAWPAYLTPGRSSTAGFRRGSMSSTSFRERASAAWARRC